MDLSPNQLNVEIFFHTYKNQNIKPLVKLDQTNIIYVDEISELHESYFDEENLIGVDIEQTNKLGYDGKICLIQIKTRQKILIIDTIRICDHQRLKQLLQKIFENPKIKIIFYAGTQDIYWLYRDFQIQVSNFCDIKDIAELLNKKTDNSLIGLWKRYCQIEFSKEEKTKFQLSDWLFRPLSEDQIFYAAQDCAYLDYIWCKLLDELMEKNILDDINKLQLKFQKQKTHEHEKKTRYQHLQYAKIHLDQTLDQFSEYYDSEYYDDLGDNDLQLIKFIFTELCEARQQFAKLKDVPIQSLDTDEQLLCASVVLYEKLSIENIDDLEEFYKEFQDYKNSYYMESWQKLNRDISYNEWRSLICNGFMNALQLDPNFVKYALTEIYNTELFKSQKKETNKKRIQDKSERAQKYNTLNKPFFGDCQLLAPDNMLLCNTELKKAQWYLKNDKAELVQENPMIIRLKFEPSGFQVTKLIDDKEIVEKQFITTVRENQCVVCGAKQNYLKYNIVPQNYKTHFPDKFKYMKTQGFVLLCIRCHEKASTAADELKETIAKEYNIPLKVFHDNTVLLKQISQLQKQMKQFKNKIINCSKEVQKKFKDNVRKSWEEIKNNKLLTEYLDLINLPLTKTGKTKLDVNFNQTLENLYQRIVESGYGEMGNLHGEKVVALFNKDDDFQNFINFWREHFVKSMQPKYLPDSWFIDGKPIGTQQIYYQASDQIKQ